MVTSSAIPVVKEVGRVPPMIVPLDGAQERRFQRLMEEVVMIDLHEHPMVLPEDLGRFLEYLRVGNYKWGYEAAKHGGWTAIATANVFRGFLRTADASFIAFEDLVEEVSMMLADMHLHKDIVVKVTNSNEIESAKQQGKVGFFPSVEHLAIGNDLSRIDTLHALGVRLAGITYSRRCPVGDGLAEENDGGLSGFGREVVRKMNDIGMVIDVSHASFKTAMEAIERSAAPILYSHNAAYTLRPNRRTRRDEELLACAKKGGLIAITAVPNSLSDDPKQDINCVLDHYDYMVRLVGVDHVGIGTDTLIGDHVGFHEKAMGRDPRARPPAPYLNGLESPSEGKNIVRGLVARGYSDGDVKKIAGGNALALFRRVLHS